MPTICIAGSDVEFACAADDTILRAALRAGLGMAYACNTGCCGNCRFELLDGEVVHERADPPAWSERDRARNRWLGCQARPAGDCRIKVRLDAGSAPEHRPVRTRARLAGILQVTHDISEFAFDLATDVPFRAGQYALLYLPGVSGGRAYSMCNLADDPRHHRFLIKRLPGGEATAALFDGLGVGDEIGLDGPYGHAWLREDAPRDILLLAGGSGLSPMVAIARAAIRSEGLRGRRIHVLYGGRAPRDVCGEAMLAELPGFGERLTYACALSETADGWTGPTGWLHEVARTRFGAQLAGMEVYFAGPPAMSQPVQTMLHEAGTPRDQIHFDEFF